VGEPIPEPWLADLLQAGAAIAAGDETTTAFTALLGDGEENALLGRIERLLEQRRFPQPGPNRHYPWPLV
jgi:hypothetical protein